MFFYSGIFWKMYKLVLVSITSVMIFTAFPLRTCSAPIAKSHIQQDVEDTLKQILVNQLVGSSSDSQATERVISRARRISLGVASLKSDEVDDNLAKWIESSIIDLVTNRAAIIAGDSPQAEERVNDIVNQEKLRFSSLDDAKGQKLWLLRTYLLSSAATYRASVQEFLSHRLSAIKIYRVDLSFSSATGMQDNLFSKVVSAVKIPIPADNGTDTTDVRQKPLDNELLTVTLIKEVEAQVGDAQKTDAFSFGNLLSRVYDDNFPIKVAALPNFSETRPQVEAHLGTCLSTEPHFTILNMLRFHHFIYDSEVLRFQKVTPLQVNFPSAWLMFKNDSTAWRLMSPKAQ